MAAINDQASAPEKRRQIAALIVFGALVTVLGLAKGFTEGWFEPRTPLELNGQPALVFFTLRRGCDCQMDVARAAEAQLAGWDGPAQAGIPVLSVDFSRRPDLAEQYGVIRAPALVLLDAQGQVVWKQDLGLSDEAPLDLIRAQSQVEALVCDNPK